MKIWLLEDGVRTGPHESFKVRERISKGELTATTMSWYEDAPEWIPLAEVPSLSSVFPKKATPPALPDEVVRSGVHQYGAEVLEQTTQPRQLHLVQRFFARFIDITLYLFLVALLKLKQGLNPYIPDTSSIYSEINYLWPYVIIDALLIYSCGTTVGKKLLKVTLTTKDGGRLGLGESLLRSLRVWIIGLGMLLIPLMGILVSWLLSLRFGVLIWDMPKQYKVSVKPITTIHLVLTVVVVMTGSAIVYLSTPEDIRPEQKSWSEYFKW